MRNVFLFVSLICKKKLLCGIEPAERGARANEAVLSRGLPGMDGDEIEVRKLAKTLDLTAILDAVDEDDCFFVLSKPRFLTVSLSLFKALFGQNPIAVLQSEFVSQTLQILDSLFDTSFVSFFTQKLRKTVVMPVLSKFGGNSLGQKRASASERTRETYDEAVGIESLALGEVVPSVVEG